jgi:hypothetical protein
MKFIPFLIALFVCNTQLNALSWYVAPNGNDSNTGSVGAPFKTIEQA